MAGSKTPAAGGAVAARKLARERIAATQEERRKRDEQNTQDLAAFFVSASKVDDAAAKRDAAIAAANAGFASAESTAIGEQAAALARIKDRGATQSEIADLTGLSVDRVGRLLKAAAAGARVADGKQSASKPKPEPVVAADPAPAESAPADTAAADAAASGGDGSGSAGETLGAGAAVPASAS
ncbi:hypothetical protein ACWF9G_22825 [Nocardia sp. NPDC055029]